MIERAKQALSPTGWMVALLSALLLLGGAAPTFAEVVTIEGASFDSILDGFPGLADLDGVPDFDGNNLAVGFKSGATAERAFGEYPLAALAGRTSASVVRATLHFNIDDVLSTFGPGTEFDGTASDPISIGVYPADGVVGLDDWGRGGVVASVQPGLVTDGTLGTTGPIAFEVDVSQPLRDVLTAGVSHLGVEWSTTDDPTGTSLDDLGVGGAGPPGVGGARLPFLTVELLDPTPVPTPTPTPVPTASAGPTPSPEPTTGPATPTPSDTPLPTVPPTPVGSTPTPVVSSPSPPTPTVAGPPPATVVPTPTPASTPPSATPSPVASPAPSPTPSNVSTPVGAPSATPVGQKIVGPPSGPSTSSALGSWSGDQILAYVESGTNRETFLSVRNGSDQTLRAEIALYDEGLQPRWIGYRDLAAGGRVVFDVSTLAADAAVPESGVVFVTSVDEEGRPVVTRALSGTATIANLVTGSAWGGATIARRAVEGGAATTQEPALGTLVDGTGVFFEQIQPSILHLPGYFALEGEGGSAPASLVFLSFGDATGGDAAVFPERTVWEVEAASPEGSQRQAPRTSVEGLRTLALDVLLGQSARESGGSLRFELGSEAGRNRLIFFHQSLAGFGIGFALPPLDDVRSSAP